MKAKKARKRLRRVDNLLSNVIEKYKTQSNVNDLLGTAKAAVGDALTKLPKKPVAKAEKPRKKPVEKKRPEMAKAAAAGGDLKKAG